MVTRQEDLRQLKAKGGMNRGRNARQFSFSCNNVFISLFAHSGFVKGQFLLSRAEAYLVPAESSAADSACPKYIIPGVPDSRLSCGAGFVHYFDDHRAGKYSH